MKDKLRTIDTFCSYEDIERYVMDRITFEERRAIRESWNKQYLDGEKDWYKYLVVSVNNLCLGK